MAGSLTDICEVDLLKLLTSQATTIFTTTQLANVYVGLLTVAGSDSAGGTEVSGGSYARIDSNGLWAAPVSGSPSSVANNATITFPTASGSWGTVVAFALYDAVSGGNRYAWGDLTVNKAVGSGDTASYASGALVLTLD
jgi:hypothetical protein